MGGWRRCYVAKAPRPAHLPGPVGDGRLPSPLEYRVLPSQQPARVGWCGRAGLLFGFASCRLAPPLVSPSLHHLPGSLSDLASSVMAPSSNLSKRSKQSKRGREDRSFRRLSRRVAMTMFCELDPSPMGARNDSALDATRPSQGLTGKTK